MYTLKNFACTWFYIIDCDYYYHWSGSEEQLSLQSVRVYSSEALSVLFRYHSTTRQDIPHSAVAQLPLPSLTALSMTTIDSSVLTLEDEFERCSKYSLPPSPLLSLLSDFMNKYFDHIIVFLVPRCERQDVGPLLTQVLSLGSFLGSSMAVSGPRKLAAVVKSTYVCVRTHTHTHTH